MKKLNKIFIFTIMLIFSLIGTIYADNNVTEKELNTSNSNKHDKTAIVYIKNFFIRFININSVVIFFFLLCLIVLLIILSIAKLII